MKQLGGTSSSLRAHVVYSDLLCVAVRVHMQCLPVHCNVESIQIRIVWCCTASKTFLAHNKSHNITGTGRVRLLRLHPSSPVQRLLPRPVIPTCHHSTLHHLSYCAAHAHTNVAMFWPWASSQVPQTDEEEGQRVEEFKLQITGNGQLCAQLRASGRDPECIEFAKRWLSSRSWDVEKTMDGVATHCEWLSAQAGAVPVTVGSVPSALIENKELFLQVTFSLPRSPWRALYLMPSRVEVHVSSTQYATPPLQTSIVHWHAKLPYYSGARVTAAS